MLEVNNRGSESQQMLIAPIFPFFGSYRTHSGDSPSLPVGCQRKWRTWALGSNLNIGTVAGGRRKPHHSQALAQRKRCQTVCTHFPDARIRGGEGLTGCKGLDSFRLLLNVACPQRAALQQLRLEITAATTRGRERPRKPQDRMPSAASAHYPGMRGRLRRQKIKGRALGHVGNGI